MPEEIVVLSSSFSTYVKSFVNVKLGIVVLTNQRVFFCEGSDVLFDIPLDQLKSFAEGKHGWSKKIVLQTKEGVEYGFLPKKKHYDLWLKYLRDPQLITSATEEASPNKAVVQEAFVPPKGEAGASTESNHAEVANLPEVTPPATPDQIATTASTTVHEGTLWYLPGIRWVAEHAFYTGGVGACCWLFGKLYMWWIGQNVGGTLLFADWGTVAHAMAGMQGTIKILYFLWHYGFWTMIWAFSIALAGFIAGTVIELKQESSAGTPSK